MSAGFLRAVATGLRHCGVPVILEPGCEARGNGMVFPDGRPAGLIIHHTGAPPDAGLSVLLQGRPDLPPPLCNSAGHADGSVRLVAAHPANHAGASGGRSMGPLPVTRLFNKFVWGHEIMYPGTQPMSAAQYRSAQVLAGVICGILGYKDAEHCRAHAETSITGKWDPGAGKGTTTIDMAAFRAGVPAALAPARPSAGEEEGVKNLIIGVDLPLKGRVALVCPTGTVSSIKRQAWLSAVAVELKPLATVWVQVFAQGAERGVEQWRWTEKDLRAREDHYLPRAWREVPPNTSHLIISWDFSACPEGGTLCLETRSAG